MNRSFPAPSSKLSTKIVFNLCVLVMVAPASAFAQSLYYDTNGSAGGTSTASSQNLTDSVWTTDPTGSITTGGFVYGDNVVFSATDGVNIGTGAQNITVNASGEAVNSFTMNNGAVTLLGSSTPNFAIGNGGITIKSNDGATTFDSSLGTITLGGNESWSNDSTQAFNVGASIASPGGNVLTFNGTGSGATTISGNITGATQLVDSSTTSVLNLNSNNNSYTGGTIIKGGTVNAASNGSLGGGSAALTLQNGAKLTVGGSSFNHPLSVTGGGTLNFTGGDIVLGGGPGSITADTLTIGTGDVLDNTSGSQNISRLNLVGGSSFSRLLVGLFTGTSGLLNGATVNVSNGYILDFATGNFGQPKSITFASGTALEMRNGATVNLDSNVKLPTAGIFTVGADDVGSGTMNLAGGINLSGNLSINVNTSGNVYTHINGAIMGGTTSALTVTGSGNSGNNSVLYLGGTNTFKGGLNIVPNSDPSVTAHAATVDINGDSSRIGDSINIDGGTLAVGPGGSLPSAAVVNIGSNGSDLSRFQIGDSSGTNSVTVGSIYGQGGNDEIVGGNSSVSNLTVHVASGVNDVYYGRVGGNDVNNGNNVSLTANGPGTLILARGDNSFSGGVYVDGASILETPFDGAIGPDSNAVTLTNGGQIFIGASISGVDGNAGPIGGGNFNHAVVLGTGGGTIGGQYDYVINNTITGGTGLKVVSGDFLANSGSGSNNTGAITVTNGGTRLLMFQAGILSGAPSVTVSNGATFDFGMGGSYTANDQITMGNGTAIEDRGTNVVLNNLVVPTKGASVSSPIPSFIIGSDDVGGGNITVANGIHLADTNLNIEVSQRVNGGTGVYFNGGFSGQGNLSTSAFYAVDGNNNPLWQDGTIHLGGTNTYRGNTKVTSGTLDLTGDNTGVTGWGGGAPTYTISSSSYSTTTNSGGIAYLQIGGGGSIASNSNIVIGSSAGFSFLVLGDGNGAVTQNIAKLSMANSAGDNASILGGSSSVSNLIVNVAAGSTQTYNGLFGSTYNTPGRANQDNLGVTFNLGTGAVMILGGFQSDNIAGGFTLNGGKVVLNGIGASGVLGTTATNVTLNNTTLYLAQGIDYENLRPDQHFILGTGTNTITSNDGITTFGGTINAGAGSELHVSGPNMLLDPVSNTLSNYSILDIDGGRTFIDGGNGTAILPTSTVNVAKGAILDFSTGTTVNSDITYNFGAGGGLIQRNNGTNVTLSHAFLPGQGTFAIGTDDVGNSGSFNLTGAQTLTGNLNLAVNRTSVAVTLRGNISGAGGLTQSAGPNAPGNLYLTGINTYAGATAVTGGTMFIQGDNSGAGDDYSVSGGATMDVGSTGSISNAANVTLGAGNTSGTFQLGDSNGASNVTVASIKTSGTGNSNQVVGGGSASTSTFTVNNNTADTYSGKIGGSGTNQNNIAFVKSGTGTLSLSGNNTYTGGTSVTAGRLAVNGSILGDVTTSVNASVGGSGLIAGTIGGAGSIDPGNSPGILTASATDPTGGLTYNFEMQQAGAPNWSIPTASGNDVLHLTSATPFTSALTSDNVINVYFTRANGTYDGSFFVEGSTDNLSANIASATFNYYLADGTGSVSYNGHFYDEITSGVTMTVIPVSDVNFGAGPIDGFTGQFTLEVTDIPEPSTYAMMIGGLAFLAFWQYRNRKSRS
jgi:autotransporter-associated beta strand protein